MTNCPACDALLIRSTAILAGKVVLACRRCRKMAVEVPGVEVEWLDGGPGVVERLERSAFEGEQMRRIMDSDADDLAWEPMG